jgi:hypothetical protein
LFITGFCLLLLLLNGLVWKTHQTQGGNYWLLTAPYSDLPEIPAHSIRYSSGQVFTTLPVQGTFLGWTADGNWLFVQTQQALYLADAQGRTKHKLMNVKFTNNFINPTQVSLAPNGNFYLVRTPISKTQSALYLVRGLHATEITPPGGFVIDLLYWDKNSKAAYMQGEGHTYEIELAPPYSIRVRDVEDLDKAEFAQFALSLMNSPSRIPYDKREILQFNDEQLRYEWSDGGIIYQLPFHTLENIVRLSPDKKYLWLGYRIEDGNSSRREIVRIQLSNGRAEQIGDSRIELKGVSPAIREPAHHADLLFLISGGGLFLLLVLVLRRKVNYGQK